LPPGRAPGSPVAASRERRAGAGELFAAYRHHGFITNSTLTTIAADERHRDHAIIEQVIAELKDGPLAHLPSGKYAAKAASTTCEVIAFNLARAAAVAADLATVRWASLRTKMINLAVRIATTGRRLDLHLPDGWACDPAGTYSGPSRPARHPATHVTAIPAGHHQGLARAAQTSRRRYPRGAA
jgi:hypothetical protein